MLTNELQDCSSGTVHSQEMEGLGSIPVTFQFP